MFLALQAFSAHSLWRKRSNTCVWLFLLVGRQKKKFIKKKWGLKSHGWLLEPATTFSLMRKSRCSLHLYFLSFLDTGASVKMCSSLQAEKRQHFWVSWTTAYQKKKKKKSSFDLKIVKKMTCKAVSLKKVPHNFTNIIKLWWIKEQKMKTAQSHGNFCIF